MSVHYSTNLGRCNRCGYEGYLTTKKEKLDGTVEVINYICPRCGNIIKYL